jgi:hypothetical protein
MPRLLWCVSTRAAVLASLIVLVTVTAGSRTICANPGYPNSRPTRAQLLERADAGAYQRYRSRSAAASDRAAGDNKDGNTTTREVQPPSMSPVASC